MHNTTHLLEDMMDRLFNRMDTLDDKIDDVKVEVVGLNHEVNTLKEKLTTHMKDEERMTKKAATLIVGAIMIISAVGFGSVIAFAPNVITSAAKVIELNEDVSNR